MNILHGNCAALQQNMQARDGKTLGIEGTMLTSGDTLHIYIYIYRDMHMTIHMCIYIYLQIYHPPPPGQPFNAYCLIASFRFAGQFVQYWTFCLFWMCLEFKPMVISLWNKSKFKTHAIISSLTKLSSALASPKF